MVDRQGVKREGGKKEELASSLSAGMVWHGSTLFQKRTGLYMQTGASGAEHTINCRTDTYLVALRV